MDSVLQLDGIYYNLVKSGIYYGKVIKLAVNTVKPVFNIKFRPHLHTYKSKFSLNTSMYMTFHMRRRKNACRYQQCLLNLSL